MSIYIHGELATWRPHCSWHLRRERFSTALYYSPLSALSKDYSSVLIASRELLVIRGWDGYRSKEPINVSNVPSSNSLRAVLSCVETAHPYSLHVSIIWFSCELGPLIWGIGACTLRAQWTPTSAMRTLLIAYWRISRSWIALPQIFENFNQPKEARTSKLGLQPNRRFL
jgi:hypothetical protein